MAFRSLQARSHHEQIDTVLIAGETGADGFGELARGLDRGVVTRRGEDADRLDPRRTVRAVIGRRDRDRSWSAVEKRLSGALGRDVTGRGAVVRTEHDDVRVFLPGQPSQAFAGGGTDDHAALD